MTMNLHAVRLNEGEDLKEAITSFSYRECKSGAVVLSAVGSLSGATLRMAGAEPTKQDIRHYDGRFEIVSLTGTIDKDGKIHLHMSISDENGTVVGGHVKEGCIVHTTCELVLASDQNIILSREKDENTGFDELFVGDKE